MSKCLNCHRPMQEVRAMGAPTEFICGNALCNAPSADCPKCNVTMSCVVARGLGDYAYRCSKCGGTFFSIPQGPNETPT